MLLTLFLLLLLPPGTNPPEQLTGHWELVPSQSNFGNLPKPTRMTVDSTIRNGVMHAVQNTYTEQGEHITEFDWYLDGKRHNTDKPAPGYSVTSWDGKTLVNERQSNDGAYKEMIRVILSPDGNTATEEITTRNPAGTNRAKLIWRKTGK
jgi:hypothetical protein